MPDNDNHLTPVEVAKATATKLVDASQILVNNAYAQTRTNPPTISNDAFRRVTFQHSKVVSEAALVLNAAALAAFDGVAENMKALGAVTTELDKKMAALHKVQNVIERVSTVLVAAGTLAAFMVAPSIGGVASVVATIRDLTAD